MNEVKNEGMKIFQITQGNEENGVAFKGRKYI